MFRVGAACRASALGFFESSLGLELASVEAEAEE